MGPIVVDGIAQTRYRYTQTINTKTVCKESKGRPEPAQDTEITREGGNPPTKMCKVKSICIHDGESPIPDCQPPSQAKLCDSSCNPPLDASGGDANDVTLTSPGGIPDYVAPVPPGLDWGTGNLCDHARAAVDNEQDPCAAMAGVAEKTFGDAGHNGGTGDPSLLWDKHPMLCPRWNPAGGLDGSPMDRPVTYPGLEPNPPHEIASRGCTDVWIACGHGTQKK